LEKGGKTERTALIVDDCEHNRHRITDLIKVHEYYVKAYANPVQALDAVRTTQFHIAFFAYNLLNA
jgi:CheY-like chemotaxis protein